ncbi:MAG: hypothetical protein ACLQVK_03325 [Acidimicrobiales bacterium]
MPPAGNFSVRVGKAASNLPVGLRSVFTVVLERTVGELLVASKARTLLMAQAVTPTGHPAPPSR